MYSLILDAAKPLWFQGLCMGINIQQQHLQLHRSSGKKIIHGLFKYDTKTISFLVNDLGI
jgi:hypothetical protein